MDTTKSAVTAVVTELLNRFDRNRSDYINPSYKEAQLRKEFLDPLFESLGWDVNNRSGNAEAYKEVIHEDSIRIAEGTKAPDYCFRIGGLRKFFVEAKKPSVDLQTDSDSAYQLRRYAWSSKLPLSILTNFAEFAVYDCRYKPSKNDRPSVARVMFVRDQELSERWPEIAGLFSRDSVLKGYFDKFLGSRQSRGTAEVDEEFLVEIESWRKDLARVLALRNPSLEQPELNGAVQLIIDRIVFLRICEDRGIEPYGQLQNLLRFDDLYKNLLSLYHKADDRYNSGLFHFSKEKNRSEPPDTLTPKLIVDDRVIRDIIKRLYYPESPYEFAVLPASILGQVYEKFLGSVIRLTSGHQARIEPKPEIRKAGGVYYTPTYIVNFIVEETLGVLLKNRTPGQVAKLKILDPACGSGSFLIEAYQYLLDWHLMYYVASGTRSKKEIYQGPKGDWRLTNAEKKRILLNNIFGVDKDGQAVEVTKLSLLLKVLEGETHESIEKQMRLFHERVLPDLGNNIRCGNSLIGPDFLTDQQMSLLEAEKDNADVDIFDWETEFSDVWNKKSGGFDVVIGNPPYVYRNATEEGLRPYYLRKYRCAEGNFELYKFFLERSTYLCSAKGRVGMIVSATFLVQPSFEKLRTLLANETTIRELAPLGPAVFKDATVDTSIIIFEPREPVGPSKISVLAPELPTELAKTKPYKVRQSRFRGNTQFVFDYKLRDEEAEIVEYLETTFDRIDSGFEFGVGINTGYIKSELVSTKKIDRRYHPMVAGDGISRYGSVRTEGWIMYDAEFVRSKGDLGRTLPAEYLLSSEKILVVRTRNLSLKRRVIATVDSSGAYNLNRLSNIVAKQGHNLFGLLGVLNSRLYNWLYSTRYYDYEIKPVYLKASPIPDINDAKLIRLVKSMLKLESLLEKARTESQRNRLERREKILNLMIDTQVEKLFRISKKQISILQTSPAFSAE